MTLCLVLPSLVSPVLAVGEGTRVSVIYAGDPFPGITPYVHMKVEPFLRVTPIQASRDHYAGISSEDIRRAIRIYMPRRYEDLVADYEVVILSDANVNSFTNKHLLWFRESVKEEGMGLSMMGGHESFGGSTGHPDWGKTPVGDALPVDTQPDQYMDGKVTILKEDNPFISSLPWRPDLPFLQEYASNIVNRRPSTQVLAIDTIDNTGYDNPFFSTWKYGQGRTFAMTGDWTPGGGIQFLRWDYVPDFATNLMLYCSQRPIPQDIELVHNVRFGLEQLAYQRALMDSLIDFVERFGAKPDRILERLTDFDTKRQEVIDLYLEQEFEEVRSLMDEASGLLEEANKVAERVKSEALFWVYVSEWLAVTATFLISGLLVWSLMIRRSLYREVSTTRYD